MEDRATYSPEDNKLRLYPAARLDSETYAKVKAAGFKWAPRQELFVAPMWTPEREDLLVELCGDVGDEDTSLVERAEERAERFEEYSDKRAADAEGAHEVVSRIADNIPMGQPILVGHHSEKRARRDAEKIQNGMRRAVKLWETSKYWEARAKGALRHVKYKELPAVRFRRIKGLEADLRKHGRDLERFEKFLQAWRREGLTDAQAREIANFDHAGSSVSVWSKLDRGEITAQQAREIVEPMHLRSIAWHERWIEHLTNRLAYERAMLGEQGGVAGTKFDLKVGGRVRVRDEWSTVLRVNRKDGDVVSVTCATRFGKYAQPVEAIVEYEPPAEGEAQKVAVALKKPPLLNVRREGAVEMTQEEYKRAPVDCKQTRVVAATESTGAYRCREVYRGGKLQWVFLTDVREANDADLRALLVGAVEKPEVAPAERVPAVTAPRREVAQSTKFDAMREQIRTGVQVVSAPQLFPTPKKLVERMMAEAEIESGHRVLEPSAGTGAIVEVLCAYAGVEVVANEINLTLARRLEEKYPSIDVHAEDFLQANLGTFDRIVMNPPFEHGADVLHVEHARSMLRPGGRLVALVADGPRQSAKLRPGARVWKSLGNAFRDQGTGVRVALAVFDASAGA